MDAPSKRHDPCVEISREPPLGEASVLRVRAGDYLAGVDGVEWGSGYRSEGPVVEYVTDDRRLRFVPLLWSGNGAGVLVLRATETGFCVVNAWSLQFGGNGLDISLAPKVQERSDGALLLHIDLVGHLRGYRPNPEEPESYVEPDQQQMELWLATDGRRAWVERER